MLIKQYADNELVVKIGDFTTAVKVPESLVISEPAGTAGYMGKTLNFD